MAAASPASATTKPTPCSTDAHAKGIIEAPHLYGDDFGSPDETYISSQFAKPVMIHRYPAAIKAFYMQPDPTDPTKALCVDVLAPEGYGEIIGGSQRVDSYDLLKSRIEEHNLPMAAFQWYLDLRKYGTVPHSGFGMGIERVRSLDLRPRPRPRNHPLRQNPKPHLSVTAETERDEADRREH